MGKARLRMLLESCAVLGRMRRGEPVSVAAEPRGMAAASNPHAQPKANRRKSSRNAKKRKAGVWRSSVYGVSLYEADRRHKWIRLKDDLLAKPIGLRNRRKGKAAMTAIGEKAQIVKLPKLPRKYHWQA